MKIALRNKLKVDEILEMLFKCQFKKFRLPIYDLKT
jgi:hypothetical protein